MVTMLVRIILRKFSLGATYSSSKKQSVVNVVGAVRTPLYNEDNPSITNLATRIIDEVIKRASLPKGDIDEVHLVGLLEEDVEKLRDSCDQLHKNVRLETANNAITSLSNSIVKLNAAKAKVVVICGVKTEFLAVNKCLKHVGDLDLEITPVFNRLKRGFISKDEFDKNRPVSIATAIALAVSDHSAKLNIKPLASFSHFNCNAKSEKSKILNKFLETQNVKKESICRWEFLLPKDTIDVLKAQLKLDASKVNCYDLASVLQKVPTIGPIVLLTHLVHNLQGSQSGLIAVQNEDHSLFTMLLEKFSYLVSKSHPTLTLYTKDNCPLCDELIDELEQHFKNEYHLEKVFIDRKENVRFLRLYRNDIPVLFVNGQFVCMHHLNKNLLRRMLSVHKKKNDNVIQ